MKKIVGTFLPFNSLYSLQHPTDLFAAAQVFIDWLAATKQSVWQILPMHATDWHSRGEHFDSPYSGYGAGLNPRFLPADGRFGPFPKAPKDFIDQNQAWLPDYCLFLALCERYGTDFWPRWPAKIDESGLEDRIEFFQDQQCYLYLKYAGVREYAKSKGVAIWGDIPFYLPVNSFLVWRNQKAFKIGKAGGSSYEAGAYGGRYFHTSQFWGFPLYNFETDNGRVAASRVWQTRVSYYSSLFNMARLDAAVRFFIFEELHLSDLRRNKQVAGPGEALFRPLIESARESGMEVFVEDISDLDMTPLFEACEKYNIAGMSVLTMCLESRERKINPRNFNLDFSKNHVYYTSTHDTLPLKDYLAILPGWQTKVIAKAFGVDYCNPHRLTQVLRSEMRKKCHCLIVPLQDWLLTGERINFPGEINETNWNYKPTTPIENLPLNLR